MKPFLKRFIHGAEFITATLLAVMFITFLLQIFSRYILLTPFGWTLELCLILWVWIVFLGCAFVVRERDHVTFDILYLASPPKVRQVFALISCAAIALSMVWSFLPTWDYIDWMKMRKTTTVKNPFTGAKIPLNMIFSIYAVFMVSVAIYYIWKFVHVLRNGAHPHDTPHDAPLIDEDKPS